MSDGFVKGVEQPRRSRAVISETSVGEPLHEHLYEQHFFGLGEDDRRGLHRVINVEGVERGTFVSAQISKIGGKNDKITVFLLMGTVVDPDGNVDGRVVVEMSFKKARILGLEKRENPFGLTLHSGKKKVRTLTIGWDTPLNFDTRLQVFVRAEEAGVSKVEATVVWGGEGGGGGDVTGTGGGSEDEFP